MPEDDSPDLSGHVDLAWRDFHADMDQRYPASLSSASGLLEHRDELFRAAAGEAARERYVDAGDMRAEARDISATLAARGEDIFDGAAQDVKADMERAILGEAPEPRTVSSRHWETRAKIDLVLNDPDANLTRLAEWTHAARYAMAYCLTAAQKEAIGMGEPEWESAGDLQPHGDAPGHTDGDRAEPMPAHAREDGPDMG